MPGDVTARCNAIEECYEYMLAYAGQGLAGSEGLAEAYADALKDDRLGEPERYRAFLSVLDRDARDSLAALQLVLAQSTISSQLIDNLNASIHLRALLTDLFLIDEILKPQKAHQKPAATK
jgi:hypothetical protein